MKYIIIGLGNFGSMLASRLTEMGHEVIGADHRPGPVDDLRDVLASTVMLAPEDPDALRTLPFDQVDIVVVAIGEDFAASIQVVALLRQMKVERIVARAISELHRNVLEALGVERVIFPEKDAAELMAQSFELSGFLGSYKIDTNHYVLRFSLPAGLSNQTIAQSGIKDAGLRLLAVIRTVEEHNALGVRHNPMRALELIPPEAMLAAGDILVVYGTLSDYNSFTRKVRD